jgi:hypothetical protein
LLFLVVHHGPQVPLARLFLFGFRPKLFRSSTVTLPVLIYMVCSFCFVLALARHHRAPRRCCVHGGSKFVLRWCSFGNFVCFPPGGRFGARDDDRSDLKECRTSPHDRSIQMSRRPRGSMVDLSREGMGFEPAVPFAGATPVPAERMGSRANTGPIQPRMGATSPVHHATVDPGVGCVLLELTDASSRSLARFLHSLCCSVVQPSMSSLPW